MRTNGTKYPEIKKLPVKALPVSRYATKENLAVGYIYVKHQRHFEPKEGKPAGIHPGYIIRCYQGTNYVIPD